MSTLSAAGASAASSEPGSGIAASQVSPVDPCDAVISPLGNIEADPLKAAGLGGLKVPAKLMSALRVANLTCSGRTDAVGSRVRGVFTELSDGGGTVAIYAALRPGEKPGSWRRYLRETFAEQHMKLTFANRGGSMLATVNGHPRADWARSTYLSDSSTRSLWDMARPIRQAPQPKEPTVTPLGHGRWTHHHLHLNDPSPSTYQSYADVAGADRVDYSHAQWQRYTSDGDDLIEAETVTCDGGNEGCGFRKTQTQSFLQTRYFLRALICAMDGSHKMPGQNVLYPVCSARRLQTHQHSLTTH